MYSTYRKPDCTYAYVQYDSNHHIHVKNAIVQTECIRLLRTNSTESSYTAQLKLFTSKLKRVGYPVEDVRAIMCKFPWAQKSTFFIQLEHDSCS